MTGTVIILSGLAIAASLSLTPAPPARTVPYAMSVNSVVLDDGAGAARGKKYVAAKRLRARR
jgi:hypothetical protein